MKIKSKKILIISIVIMILPWVIMLPLADSSIPLPNKLLETAAKISGILFVVGIVGILYCFNLLKKN